MTTVLDQVHHARIIQDLTEVCTRAGVQAKFMHESMKNYCEAPEIEWVREFRRHEKQGMPGMCLVGVKKPDTRCQAMAAALLRNYIDARVIPLNTLLEDGTGIEPHALFIPNLYVSGYGKGVPTHVIQKVYDLLMSRAVQGKPSVVCVESMKGVLENYGAPFADFLSGFKEIS